MPAPDDLHAPMPLGPHTASGLFRVLLPEEAQWLRLPSESYADCSICPPAMRGEYDPGCRCCGYIPHVPNLLLGLALEDDGAAPLIEGAIGDGLALPSGLWAPPARLRRKVELDAADKFGTEATMACPFLKGDGGCGIYAYRNSVCSTFFCVNDHGEPGETLWSTMHALMGNAETGAAQWAMGEAGLSWELQAERMAELVGDLDRLSTLDGWTPEALAHIWGEWWGREAEFYAACIASLRGAREGFWERLADLTPTDAVGFELAQRDWIPEEFRDEVPPIATGDVSRMPTDDLWYRIQLRLKQLWDLPLDGETVRWATGIQIAGPSNKLPLLMGSKHRVAGASRLLWLDDTELALLERFRGGARIDGALLDSPEAEALENPRELLAHLLRRGVLVV